MISIESIEVRAAGPEDITSLALLFDDYRVFYREASAPEKALAFVSSHVTDRSTRFFVARSAVETSPLGFVHLIPSFNTLVMRPIWFLEDLFVRREARRRGVAAALMAHAETFAREQGAERLTLATAHDNFPAQALYRKLGYVREEHFAYFHRFLP
jgi:ribosomal protein S18 acetylase RimI-like enzyme